MAFNAVDYLYANMKWNPKDQAEAAIHSISRFHILKNPAQLNPRFQTEQTTTIFDFVAPRYSRLERGADKCVGSQNSTIYNAAATPFCWGDRLRECY